MSAARFLGFTRTCGPAATGRRRWLHVVALCMAVVPRAGAETLVGPQRVIDGDTIRIADLTIRLIGIDAPEPGQPCLRDGDLLDCSLESESALAALLAVGDAQCDVLGHEGRDLRIAVCRVAEVELNRELVRQGWAMAYRAAAAAGPSYAAEQLAAANARRGLWAGQFAPPWEWRARR